MPEGISLAQFRKIIFVPRVAKNCPEKSRKIAISIEIYTFICGGKD